MTLDPKSHPMPHGPNLDPSQGLGIKPSSMAKVGYWSYQVVVAPASGEDIRHGASAFPDEGHKLEDDPSVMLDLIHQAQVHLHLKGGVGGGGSFTQRLHLYSRTASVT